MIVTEEEKEEASAITATNTSTRSVNSSRLWLRPSTAIRNSKRRWKITAGQGKLKGSKRSCLARLRSIFWTLKSPSSMGRYPCWRVRKAVFQKNLLSSRKPFYSTRPKIQSWWWRWNCRSQRDCRLPKTQQTVQSWWTGTRQLCSSIRLNPMLRSGWGSLRTRRIGTWTCARRRKGRESSSWEGVSPRRRKHSCMERVGCLLSSHLSKISGRIWSKSGRIPPAS